MKICILDGYSLNPGDLDWSPVERLGDVTLFDRTPADKIVERAADADIVLTNKVPFSADTLPEGITPAPLHDVLASADVVSLHCPLTPSTRHLINAASIAKMKPSAILINTGRGPLVDEQAVADALNGGRLAAFGADVLSQEPPRGDNPLLSARNCFLTPHIAWATIEARTRLMSTATENVRQFIAGEPVANRVN